MPDSHPDAWADRADDIRRARDAVRDKLAERVAELEAEAKALADDRGKLMRVLVAQTGETMRLRGACEAALAMLRGDRPQAALALIEETTRA